MKTRPDSCEDLGSIIPLFSETVVDIYYGELGYVGQAVLVCAVKVYLREFCQYARPRAGEMVVVADRARRAEHRAC